MDDGEWGMGNGVLLRELAEVPGELSFICFFRSELSEYSQVVSFLIAKSLTYKNISR
jgi:hypothetical protein